MNDNYAILYRIDKENEDARYLLILNQEREEQKLPEVERWEELSPNQANQIDDIVKGYKGPQDDLLNRIKGVLNGQQD